jgi:hypothetical protein
MSIAERAAPTRERAAFIANWAERLGHGATADRFRADLAAMLDAEIRAAVAGLSEALARERKSGDALFRVYRDLRDRSDVPAPGRLEQALAAASDWADRQFPASTNRAKVAHLKREVEELELALALGGPEAISEECADVGMLLGHIVRANGVELARAILAKLDVNIREREWGQADADGVIEHVR